jgi:hypothetical protein
MISKGLSASNAFTKFDSFGTHTEGYWRGEFGALYQWLFQNENLSVATANVQSPNIIQTISGKIYIEDLPNAVDFEIYNILGSKMKSVTLSNGVYELPDELSQGIYILKSTNADITSMKLVKN